MTVQSESGSTVTIVEMENGKSYLRFSADNWWEYYGNSLEGLWDTEEEKLEIMHQEYIKGESK